MEADFSAAKIAAVVFLNFSIAVLLGATLATMWLQRTSSAWASLNVARLRRIALGAFVPAFAAYFAVLWLEAASMAEVPLSEAGAAVHSVLTATHYGFAWKIGSLALAVAVLLAIGGGSCMLRLLALGVFLYSRSMVSHAGAAESPGWAIVSDWMHFVLIGVWIGEVAIAGFVTLRSDGAAGSADPQARAAYIRALSHSATIALTGIFATGVYNAWHGLGSLEHAIGTPYANTLLAKLAPVFAAATLGGYNRFLVMPNLLRQLGDGTPADDASRRFVFVLRIEALFLLGALVLAAVLSTTPPPGA